MDDGEIDRILSRCEHQLGSGRVPDLRAEGFWRAVAAIKRRADLVGRYADRAADIDLAAFRARVAIRMSAAGGIALLVLGTLFGLVVLWLAAAFQHPTRELLVLIGMGAMLVCTHDLAHFVVGSISGIRFTDWFIDLPRVPYPGLKIDYGSYLRVPPATRAWMHASGAIVSKVVPFLVLLYAVSIACDAWAVIVLAAIGIVSIVTDVLFSVKASDWKRYAREMRLARR
ncbi:MAG: hypothetical protein E6J24_14855 [Chloroflexi bacterium]|nr:MAG: hypothetical protein E6J24_14855 [Chloroflexota bacterium]